MLAPLYLIRASHIIPVVRRMDSLSISTGFLLKKVGLRAEILNSPNQLVLESSLWKLFALAAQQESSPHLASRLTETSQLSDYGEFPAKLLKAGNLYQALQLLVEHIGVHNNNRQFWLEKDSGQIWLCNQHQPCDKQGGWQVEQHILNLMCRLVAHFAGTGWTPASIKVQDRDALGIEHSYYFKNAQVEHSKAYSAIAIDTSLLRQKEMGFIRLTELDRVPNNFSAGFKLLLKDNYFGRDWLAENIAESLEVSVRTLKRKLRVQDTSLREVFDEVRYKQACELIEQGIHDYETLSKQLAYTHPNNFVRAFKRWSGVTPREYIRLRNISQLKEQKQNLF